MPINKEDVLYTAKLAKLTITDAEAEELTKEMGRIVEFVEKINEVNTEKVEPLASVLAGSNVFREDKPTPSLEISKTEELAPKFESGHIVVPAVIE